ncbi:ABC transporter permease subunit [Helicobacter saguini]|uniref:ABC transporter permease n=1 Tax=Helicobacter saguini TaxID=1548018 RepID=A0A347VLS4_9HELI|nr:ABC transporter permease [Helicobacter saguini]MWV61682.1 ABC transporter permease subunit [Helicobacter saguini]MWV67645.1 ABC transporter permease subunit [Helicobacter saguini]MWV69997.1 ABC transporter permease subunit [Helicobacter saguini]MWV72789.1 ABC transporter permease subunit [Helicobacter saguini]TLD92699.1 ABC transporter permease [Helicobacter saguini]
MLNKKWFWRVNSLVLIVVLLFLWQFFAMKYANTQLLPAPSMVWDTFIEMSQNNLLSSMEVSLQRFAIGFSIGAVLAIFCGFILGMIKNLEILLEPLIQLLRPISPVAWIPLLLLWVGIGEMPCILIIAYAVFFPVLSLCITGVRQVNHDYILMAKNFGASPFRIFFNIILPSTFLHLSSGLKLAASVAWIHLVAGEMLGPQSGLGYIVQNGRNTLETAEVIVGMFLIGILGYIIYTFFVLFERIVTKFLGGKFS